MATVAISVLNNGINLNSSNNFIEIEFDEVVTGFETGDVTVIGATKSSFFIIGDTRYLQRISVGGTPGTISVSISADAVTPNLDADTSYTFSYDADGVVTEITTPIVTIAYDIAKAVSQVATGVTFTWSSTTTAFTASDVSVVNGTLSNFAGSGTTYTADLTPQSGTGTLTTTVAADAVPDSVAVSATLEYAPFTTTITVPTQEVGLMFDITVAFSHVVTDVEVTDFRLRRSDGVFIALNSTNTTITQTPGTNEYTFVIMLTGTPDDTFRMRLDANQVAFDSNTYPVVAFTGPTFTIDYTNRDPVTLMISTTNMNIVQNEVVAIDVVFGETITGLTAFDFTVTGGTVGALTGSGDSYVLLVTAGAPGTLTVSLPVGAVLPSNAAVSEDFTIRAVTVVISTTDTHIRLNEVVAIDVMFGESITGLMAFDFVVTGGTVGALTGSGDSYTLSVTAGMVGTLRVTLPAGSVTPSNALTSQDFTINPATNLTIEAIDDQKIPVGSRDYVLVIDIGGDPDSVRPSGDLEGFDHTWDATKGQLSIRAVEVTRLVIGARWIILVSKGTDDFLEGKIFYSVVPVGPVISDPGAQTLYKGFPFSLMNEVANVPTVVRGSGLLAGLKYDPSSTEAGESAILTAGTFPLDAITTEDSFDINQYAENDGGNDTLIVPVTIETVPLPTFNVSNRSISHPGGEVSFSILISSAVAEITNVTIQHRLPGVSAVFNEATSRVVFLGRAQSGFTSATGTYNVTINATNIGGTTTKSFNIVFPAWGWTRSTYNEVIDMSDDREPDYSDNILDLVLLGYLNSELSCINRDTSLGADFGITIISSSFSNLGGSASEYNTFLAEFGGANQQSLFLSSNNDSGLLPATLTVVLRGHRNASETEDATFIFTFVS